MAWITLHIESYEQTFNLNSIVYYEDDPAASDGGVVCLANGRTRRTIENSKEIAALIAEAEEAEQRRNARMAAEEAEYARVRMNSRAGATWGPR